MGDNGSADRAAMGDAHGVESPSGAAGTGRGPRRFGCLFVFLFLLAIFAVDGVVHLTCGTEMGSWVSATVFAATILIGIAYLSVKYARHLKDPEK